MLLQPRKFNFKKKQKQRSFKKYRSTSLVYGTSGLRILRILKISGKQIFRLKVFLKKAIRKSDFTKRLMWFNAFPHLPLSKKAKGVRMGKGVGKLSLWYTQLYAGTVVVEFKNLRLGRMRFFTKQLIAKFPVPARIINTQSTQINVTSLRRTTSRISNFY